MDRMVTKFTKLKKTLAEFSLRRKNYEQKVEISWKVESIAVKNLAKVELLQYLALSINPSPHNAHQILAR